MLKKAVVIGGYGHIGSYAVPKLVNRGYDVTVISRGNSKPYNKNSDVWDKVKNINCDRKKMAEEGKFGEMIAEMQPDLIFDAICFTKEQAEELCTPILKDASLAEKTKLIEIGSIWIYGEKLFSPVTEEHPHNSPNAYGKGKSEIERYILNLSKNGKLNTTMLHPGHISGEGWYPINPQGNINPKVYSDIISGREILLPDDGSATLHHVHAEDIAGIMEAVLDNPEASMGEAFNITAKKSITLKNFAEVLYDYFGKTPAVSYLPFSEFAEKVGKKDADVTLDHISRSPDCSMEKAEKLLGFVPKNTIADTVISALRFKIAEGEL